MKNRQDNDRNSFSRFMGARQAELLKGKMLDPETNEFVSVNETKSEILLASTARRAAQHNRLYKSSIEQLAADQAKADPSDPFVYDKVRSNLLTGVSEMRDYSVSFIQNKETINGPNGPVEKVTDEPINWRHA